MDATDPDRAKTRAISFSPFVFSAQSKQSLRASVVAHAAFLEEHPFIDAANYSWTLRSRRSRLPLRITFPASTIEELRSRLQNLGDNFSIDTRSAAHGTQLSVESRILGVFTGQGAQWVRMGAELVETSKLANEILADLDDALAQLPSKYRPSWTLRQQMVADSSSSRVNEASISQPLCTAVQIILVQLLRSAGVGFAAVIGHSSGEIAAAFAAGCLSAHDAIRIAYLRGWNTDIASSPQAVQGRMLAVGTTLADANELCDDEAFTGRVKVAACNSPESVTLSGDEDAIIEMKEIFEDENKFVRMLRVDKAYHSHHMVPCSQDYLNSMESLLSGERLRGPRCKWVSSVNPDRGLGDSGAAGPSYWVDNLLSPVLFSQAVEQVVSSDHFDAAIELGPHPALKGPVRDTLQTLGIDLPYTGLLNRNTDALQSISQALGYLWTHVDGLHIDFDGYERAMGSPAKWRFIPDLPVYRWNHSQRFWHESSLSQSLRKRSDPVHPLLGDLMPYSSPHQLTWKAILRPRDLPWLHHHRIQGQPVFPAAGYAVVAMETVPFLAREQSVQIIEIENLAIHQAVIFSNDPDVGIEVRCVISCIKRDDPDKINSHFTFEACTDDQSTFYLAASGEVIIHVGEPSHEILPTTNCVEPYMVDVPADLAYSALDDIGYGYTGPFRALSGIKRRLGKVSGSLSLPIEDGLILHPATLDAAFHSIILAFSHPNDRRLWTLHLPTHLRRLRVNPSLCGQHWYNTVQAPFVATMPETQSGHKSTGFTGDVEIHDSTGNHTAVQVEGLQVVPFTPASIANDQQTFYVTDWIDSEPNAHIPNTYESTEKERNLAWVLERGSFFYLHHLDRQIPESHPGRLDKYNAAYLAFAAHTTEQVQNGTHRYAKQEWERDSLDDIVSLTQPYATHPEIKAMHIVGEQMPRAIRGETSMLEHLVKDGLLGQYYSEAQSVTQGTDILAATVSQITRRYPRARIIEVGAGTGGATREIFKHVGNQFANYTFTDISAGFFDHAQSEFASHADRMKFQTLDLEDDITSQGFEKNSFDVVVASFVLHATKSLEQTLKRVRELLRPGGYLVIYEVTNVDIIRGTALFGCLPGWWQGLDEGRTAGACVPESRWHAIMRKTGFSGIDSMTPIHDSLSLPNSVMVTQAVDDWINCLREPLIAGSSFFGRQSIIKHLSIVGGTTAFVSGLIQDVSDVMRATCDEITIAKSFDSFDGGLTFPDTTVLVLQDLDSPVFKDLTEARWSSLKQLFGLYRSIVWVTRNRMTDNPFGNMALGFARSALWEIPEVRYQSIDFEDTDNIDVKVLAEAILRFRILCSGQRQRDVTSSIESEIVIDSGGRQKIPRLQPARSANDRYNSARRSIRMDASPQVSPIGFSIESGIPLLRELPAQRKSKLVPSSTQTISLRASHSSLRALRTQYGDLFVVLGVCESSGAQFVGFSNSVASRMRVPLNALVPCSVPPQLRAVFLLIVMTNFLMPSFERGLAENDTLLIHNAPLTVAHLISQHASAAGIKVAYTATSIGDAKKMNWIYLNRNARQSELVSRLPTLVARCIDFTVGQGQSLITQLLPQNTNLLPSNLFFAEIGSLTSSDGEWFPQVPESLKAVAEKSITHLSALQQEELSSTEIDIGEIENTSRLSDAMTIINWEAPSVNIAVHPAVVQFKQDRSYWLFGLSSDLGISIADWMVQNGAQHLIITSRKPKIDSAWLKGKEAQGVVVRVIPW